MKSIFSIFFYLASLPLFLVDAYCTISLDIFIEKNKLPYPTNFNEEEIKFTIIDHLTLENRAITEASFQLSYDIRNTLLENNIDFIYSGKTSFPNNNVTWAIYDYPELYRIKIVAPIGYATSIEVIFNEQSKKQFFPWQIFDNEIEDRKDWDFSSENLFTSRNFSSKPKYSLNNYFGTRTLLVILIIISFSHKIFNLISPYLFKRKMTAKQKRIYFESISNGKLKEVLEKLVNHPKVNQDNNNTLIILKGQYIQNHRDFLLDVIQEETYNRKKNKITKLTLETIQQL